MSTHRPIDTSYDATKACADWLTERIPRAPKMALVLGSGLGFLADSFEDPTAIDYHDIPNFPQTSVIGHAGRLVFGHFEGHDVVAMQGRFHSYEGFSPQEIAFPIRVMKLLGCERLLVTNSAGGVNSDYYPGDLMLIRDHINLTGANPLEGPNDERFGPRFPDMSDPYSFGLRRIAMDVARERGQRLRTGVYASVRGPSYETPAEVRMLRRMGADAVGMSTVFEVITARHTGIEILGISCITNMASGLSEEELSHDEVTETAALVRDSFSELLRAIMSAMRD